MVALAQARVSRGCFHLASRQASHDRNEFNHTKLMYNVPNGQTINAIRRNPARRRKKRPSPEAQRRRSAQARVSRGCLHLASRQANHDQNEFDHSKLMYNVQNGQTTNVIQRNPAGRRTMRPSPEAERLRSAECGVRLKETKLSQQHPLNSHLIIYFAGNGFKTLHDSLY